ncbi:hypothetical protein CEJ63_24395, partial [Acinetobacter baumannii]
RGFVGKPQAKVLRQALAEFDGAEHDTIERHPVNLAAFGGAMSPVICGYLLINAAPTSMFYALGALTALGGTLCFLSGRRVAASPHI